MPAANGSRALTDEQSHGIMELVNEQFATQLHLCCGASCMFCGSSGNSATHGTASQEMGGSKHAAPCAASTSDSSSIQSLSLDVAWLKGWVTGFEAARATSLERTDINPMKAAYDY